MKLQSFKLDNIDFYDYKIASVMIDGVRMFVVSDLLNQYNQKHKPIKQFKNYLRNDQTKELLINWPKEFEALGYGSTFVEPDQIRCRATDGRNSDPQYNKVENADDKGGSDPSDLCKEADKAVLWDIPHVIQYVTFEKTFGCLTRGYVVCEQLLIDCLMWADRVFANKVLSFLTNLRAVDNDMMVRVLNDKDHQIETLQKDLNTALAESAMYKNRYIEDTKDQQWTYVLKIVKKDDHFVHLMSSYNRKKLRHSVNEKNRIYYVKKLPNGYTFRYNAFDRIREIVERYGGCAMGTQRSEFIIPLCNWDDDDKSFDYSIRMALKQVRQDLCWRCDLGSDDL